MVSALNDDEASQCLLSTLNSQNWAGGPHARVSGMMLPPSYCVMGLDVCCPMVEIIMGYP